MRLDTGHALDVATLHHQGGFARGWEPAECAALIADSAVAADGVFSGGDSHPEGFVISRKAADEAEILTIAVRGSARRRGLGRSLMDEALRRLYRDRIATCFLEVDPDNAAAIGLYRSFGFDVVGERKGYYRKAAGAAAAPALVMRAQLR